jgi:hypothetical protein
MGFVFNLREIRLEPGSIHESGFAFLDNRAGQSTAALCGRNEKIGGDAVVQVRVRFR